ncbi:MAG: hypothetical protein H6510_07760 [Acidobacteria bacterium]|nr:hypothetical protein [Acidobacteriota bacterium]
MDFRAALYLLAHREKPIKWLLLPMIHVGSATYYETILSRLNQCDGVLMEGVRTTKAKVLFHLQSWMLRYSHLDLVPQKAFLHQDSIKIPIVQSDLSHKAFDQDYGQVPLWLKGALWLFFPFLYLYGHLLTRNMLARNLAIEDLVSREENLEPDTFEPMDQLILLKRDDHLIETMHRLQSSAISDQTLAICWGAKHMRAIAYELMHLQGYHVESAEWVTIFPLEQDPK